MYKKNDPLVEAVRKVMSENDIRRDVEAKLNEELGIYNKKHLPHEYHAAYDEMLAEAIEKAMINEMAESQAQQKAAGAALSAKRGETSVSELRGASKQMYKSMSEKQIRDFAKTKLKGLPEKVNESNELDEVLNEIAANLYSDMYSIFESGDAQAYIDFMNSLTEEQLELLGFLNEESQNWLERQFNNVRAALKFGPNAFNPGEVKSREPTPREVKSREPTPREIKPVTNTNIPTIQARDRENTAQGMGSVANTERPSGGNIPSDRVSQGYKPPPLPDRRPQPPRSVGSGSPPLPERSPPPPRSVGSDKSNKSRNNKMGGSGVPPPPTRKPPQSVGSGAAGAAAAGAGAGAVAAQAPKIPVSGSGSAGAGAAGAGAGAVAAQAPKPLKGAAARIESRRTQGPRARETIDRISKAFEDPGPGQGRPETSIGRIAQNLTGYDGTGYGDKPKPTAAGSGAVAAQAPKSAEPNQMTSGSERAASIRAGLDHSNVPTVPTTAERERIAKLEPTKSSDRKYFGASSQQNKAQQQSSAGQKGSSESASSGGDRAKSSRPRTAAPRQQRPARARTGPAPSARGDYDSSGNYDPNKIRERVRVGNRFVRKKTPENRPERAFKSD